MKKIYALTLLCFFITTLSAQVNINQPWVWAANDKRIPSRPDPGVKGVAAPDNTPGGRKEAMVWHWSGTTYLFGGYGFAGNEASYLNDLWKHDAVTNQWTWISGDNAVNQLGVYGTLGVPGASNKPGARRNAKGLVDATGNLWLFSGHGYDESGLGVLSDLWKYDPVTNEWTWYAGPKTINYAGSTGTMGVPSPTNWPAGRHGASFWQDGLGKIWIFGGHGGSGAGSALNDLWVFDPNTEQWAWMGNGGPTGRGGSMTWADNWGNLYLFGGIAGGATVSNPAAFGYQNINQGTRYNDVWTYTQSTNSWTQLRAGGPVNWGTKGVFDPANQPGNKNDGVAWKDADGNFWLQGGTHGMTNNPGAIEYFHDVWKYDVATNQWAWMNGSNLNTREGQYGTQGVPDVNNIAYAFKGASAWVDDNGKFWMFGGESNGFFATTYRNTVWKFDPLTNETTWIKGDDNWRADPRGEPGIEDPANGPGERYRSGGWYDNNGNLWLFGGSVTNRIPGAPVNRFGDIWKYNISSGQWTWMNGLSSSMVPNYGTTGVPSATTQPGARTGMHTWTDNSNNLWLYSGANVVASSDDLWKYDIAIGQWTFVKGNRNYSAFPNHGTQGVANTTNSPGGREDAAVWKDNSGNLWLFSGTNYNDLWKYDIASNQWTWMKGNNPGQSAIYGTKGVADVNNTPGIRSRSTSWTDNAGNLWLFGGSGFDGTNPMNELWKYDPVTNLWTWVHGDNSPNTAGIYGTRGTASATNKPGARSLASGWKDNLGNLWVMGGLGYDINGNFGELNDLWMYNISTNQWTWVKGDKTIGQNGIHGTKGVPNVNNKPGSRYGATAWTDGLNKFWLYGGNGYGEWGKGMLSDLWTIAAPVLGALPVRLLEFNGQLVNNDGVLRWKTENEENAASYIVERSTDRRQYTPVGTITANNTPGKHSYSFTDPGIDVLGKQVVYYKLKQLDIDGKATYSNIVALTIDKSSFVLFYPNPVRDKANVTITLDNAEQVQARVIGNTGAVVKQWQWKLAAGSTIEEIDMGTLPTGQYYLELIGESISKRIAFVKQ